MESTPRLSTPEEELAYLRAQVAEKERQLMVQSGPPAPQESARIVSETILEHATRPQETFAPAMRIEEPEAVSRASEILRELSLGADESKISELQKLASEKGIRAALVVLEKLQNPHIADDFHRYLVRYIAAGLTLAGTAETEPRYMALHMTLYAITLPESEGKDAHGRQKTLKELVSAMEQFYAGLLSVEKATKTEPRYFALELAVPADSPELQFYVSVPNAKRDLFEKQLLGVFPEAQLQVRENDYNVFQEGGGVALATMRLERSAALPLKDYSDFDYDPLNSILNAFSKIEGTSEGAALQIVVEPRGQRHIEHYQKMLAEIRMGASRSAVLATPETVLGEFARGLGSMFLKEEKDEQKKKEKEMRNIEENKQLAEEIQKKIAAPIVGATVRLAVSAASEERAGQVLSEIEASFNQFSSTDGNQIAFSRVASKNAGRELEDFSFRLPGSSAVPLSLRELTTLYHFPPEGIESSPHLNQSRASHAAAPLSLPQAGALLGTNAYRGVHTPVYLAAEDRLRHLYVIGQTGTGKTGLLKSLIMQDIRNGDGCCFIDPHGNDILDVLAAVPPERYNDVIYFDPADLSRPFALNFLEYDYSRPEQKTFIVNELLAIFRRLYGDVPESMGPAFEQYFRNATLLVMEDPSSGSTILDIARVLSNDAFRREKLAKSMNPIVNQFWTEIATKAGGEAALENIVPYITNKFDDFTANDFIRPIVGQQESSFKFREVMDHKKILLINLSKGRLGERNANLLGLIVVGKLFMAALSRADNPRGEFPPFYLYIDEFQNVTTDSIPGILSEARKYKLSLSMAHQFLGQIDEKTRLAVFGNVGNTAVFRVGEEDAEFFEKQFAPTFDASDFVGLENRNAYVKILAGGVPQKPFDLRTADLPAGNPAQVDDLIHLSSQTYGRDRGTVESMIRERYLSRGTHV